MKVCPGCGSTYPAEAHACDADGLELQTRPDGDHLVGKLVDRRYRLIRMLGQGATSVVFAARHELMQRDVALKILWDGLARDVKYVQRFAREVQAIAAIDHPHVIEVYDCGHDDDVGYYAAMRLLEGQDLLHRLKSPPPLTFDEVFTVAIQTAQALGAAHAAGIVHRDIKPSNVFLQVDPRTATGFGVRVLDFGIAKVFDESLKWGKRPGRELTDERRIVGTPLTMSPEQVRGRELDGRSDVYGFGALLFRVFTGHYPLSGKTVQEILMHQLNTTPPPPSTTPGGAWVPPAIDDLLWRMMAKDREARPATMQEVIRGLEANADDLRKGWMRRDKVSRTALRAAVPPRPEGERAD